MSQELLAYLPHYFLNIALELPIALLVLGRMCGWRRPVIACLIGNTMTHPSLFLLFPRLLPSIGAALLMGEVLALGVEWAIYWLIARPRVQALSLTASAAANLCSLMAGVAIFS